MLFFGCENDFQQSVPTELEPSSSEVTLRNNTNDFEVYFAQTHVLRPSDQYFELVSNRAALLKAQVTSEHADPAPVVTATLTSKDGEESTLILSGPATLPTSFDPDPCNVVHSFEDSFTAVIPADWVQPGLQVRIEAGSQSAEFIDLNVGAPNKIIMNMFDFHFFSLSSGDYPANWKTEISEKLPVSEIELRRLPDVVFEELTIPPRSNQIKAARVSSPAEYLALTGKKFDGEQAAAQRWKSALKEAAGLKGRHALFYGNIYGVRARGGEGGNFGGVGGIGKIGILHHELGHALSLGHWGNVSAYPYRNDMCDHPAPLNTYNKVHVGPTWAFDLGKMDFISPYVSFGGYRGPAGSFKVDPMQGGGVGMQDEGYLLNHFSDYSVYKIRDYLSWHMVAWNGASYADWNQETGEYSDEVTSTNEVDYPIERDVEVISVMAGYSSSTEQANIVYPPIGPYISGYIRLFDPELEDDRMLANQVYCPPANGCDLSLRVEQGGVTKTYMLPIGHVAGVAETAYNSFNTKALNLKAADGPVTKIELLDTPNVEDDGLPVNPEVLYTWQ